MSPLVSLRRLLGIPALVAIALCAAGPVPRAAVAAETADPAGDLYKLAQEAYKKLEAMPKDKKKRHHWQNVIDRFQAVADKHPKSYRSDDALYMIAKLYFEMYGVSAYLEDLDKSVAAAKTCAARFPTSNYADDCLLLQAKAQLRMGSRDGALAALKTIVTEHAKGDQVREAEGLLSKEGIKVAAVPTPAPTPTVVPAAQKKRTSGGESGAESHGVGSVKVWSNEGYTQVAIYGGGPMAWSVNELPATEEKNHRIYVDLKKAHIAESLKTAAEPDGSGWRVKIEDGLLQQARVAQFDPETVRVVLDVASMEDFTVIPMEDPFRVLVQVFGRKNVADVPVAVAKPAPGVTPGTVISLPTPAPTATPDPVAIAKDLAESQKTLPIFQQLGLKVGRIYIDAGHGGDDPGAIGPTKVREKDVTLKIAKKLQKELKELGYDAILTRTDDTYLSLEERSGIANEGKGDLFVSIHCNSTDGNKSASAVETYFANTATDAAAARLAAEENKTTESKMSELDQILKGLLRGAFTPMSAELAGSVQRELYREIAKVTPETKDHGVKSALFYVLLTAQMPAILVETSFISNKKDEKLLKDEKHQEKIAKAIARGIESYLQSRFPARPIEVAKEPADKKAEAEPRESEKPKGKASGKTQGAAPASPEPKLAKTR